MSNVFHGSSVPRPSLIHWFPILSDNVTHNWSVAEVRTFHGLSVQMLSLILNQAVIIWQNYVNSDLFFIISVVSLAQTPIYISILPRFALWILHAKPQALWGLCANALTEMFILPKVTEKSDWDFYRLLRKPDHRDVGTGSIASRKK